MTRIYTMLLAFLFFSGNIQGQESKPDRSQLSLMVVSADTGKAGDHAYNSAIAEINSALLNKGYKHTMDDKTRRRNVVANREPTADIYRSSKVKGSIESSAADILIEAELHWMESSGLSPARQLQISLKAVDNYTDAVYAHTIIRSKQRQFPGMEKAVYTTLYIDEPQAFEKFLSQLDASYAILLKEGRSLNMQFEINHQSQVRFSDKVTADKQVLSDKIEEYVRSVALNKQYRIIGIGATYINIVAQVPVVDKEGYAVTPNWHVGKGAKNYFDEMGFDVDYVSIRNLMKFVIKHK